MNLCGLDVIINPMCDNCPRMTVSNNFAALMPPQFVDELNAWMLEFFGTENRTYLLYGTKLVVGPKGLERLRAVAQGRFDADA